MTRHHGERLALSLALVLCAGLGLSGQDSPAPAAGGDAAAPAAEAKRFRIMVDFAGPEGQDPLPYLDSLEASLIQSPMALAVVRAPQGVGSLATRAERSACALAIQLGVTVEGDQARIKWTIYAPPGSEAAGRGSVAKDLPDPQAFSTTFWNEAIEALEAASAGMEEARKFLTLVGRPGTLVSGIGEDILLPESGKVDVPLVMPAYVVWSATAPGARKEGGTRIVKESGSTLVIPFRPELPPSKLSIDTAFYGLAFPELGLRWDISRRFFLKANLGQYLAGLALQGQQGFQSSKTAPASLISSIELVQPGLGGGFVFSAPTAPFRLYASFDLFARIAFPEGKQLMLDPVAPIGSQLAMGFDWGKKPGIRLYFELGAALYPWAYPGLMIASWSGQGMPRLTGGGAGLFNGHPGWFVEFPVPRLGLRIHL